jgi:hypothetical protein
MRPRETGCSLLSTRPTVTEPLDAHRSCADRDAIREQRQPYDFDDRPDQLKRGRDFGHEHAFNAGAFSSELEARRCRLYYTKRNRLERLRRGMKQTSPNPTNFACPRGADLLVEERRFVALA